jgi:hypothetical protein
MDMVDDATSKTEARMGKEETAGALLAAEAGLPELWAHKKQGFGLRMGGRDDTGLLPGSADRLHGAKAAEAETT